MSTANILLISLAACGVVWFVVSTLLIYENLRKRGQKVRFISPRTAGSWRVSRYKEITKKETGKIGGLFYHWIISINIALL
jgi:hypothetical protein